MSEKTEQPTPQRLREARRKGQLARSRLLAAAAVTAAGGACALLLLPAGAGAFLDFARQLLSQPGLAPAEALHAALLQLLRLAGPVLGAALVASAGVSVLFAGLQAEPGHLTPQLERVDPLAGLRRLFSVTSLLEVARGAAVVALLGWLVWGEAEEVLALALSAVRLEGAQALGVVLTRLESLLGRCALLLLVLGLLDWGLALHRHRKELMMTREEVKQEHKQSEGDPHHKAQRKALHRQVLAGGPARGVHKATAVVVNPTHIAVALRYAPEECEAPYLVAKGQEEDALALRREAARQGIPVVRDVPLARSLVHYDVGEPIPEELYRAAAAVLAVAARGDEVDSHPRSGTS